MSRFARSCRFAQNSDMHSHKTGIAQKKPRSKEAAARAADGFWFTVKASSDSVSEVRANPWIVHEMAPASGAPFKREKFMHAAVRRGNVGLIEYGCEVGLPLEDRDASSRTVLHTLVSGTDECWQGRDDARWACVQRLLDAGARCATVDNEGYPLWFMKQSGLQARAFMPPGWTDKVLDGGAPVNCYTREGESILGFALALMQYDPSGLDCIRAVLARKPDLNSHCKNLSLSPLSQAFRTGREDLVRMLVDAGADLHVRDWQGNGLLHTVDNARSVPLMLKIGVDPEVRNYQGRTALQHVLAQQFQGVQEIAKELVAGGANLDAPSVRIGKRTPRGTIAADSKRLPEVLQVCQAMAARDAALSALSETAAPAP